MSITTSNPKVISILSASVLLVAGLLLAGCGETDTSATTTTSSSTQPINVNEDLITPLSPDLLAEVGRDNLFEPQVQLEPTSIATAVGPEAAIPTPDKPIITIDPFEGIEILGIMANHNNKKSLAIVKDEHSKSNLILKEGQSFASASDPNSTIKVMRIHSNKMVLATVGANGQPMAQKTVYIAKLIGYSKNSSSPTASVAGTNAATKSDAGNAATPPAAPVANRQG